MRAHRAILDTNPATAAFAAQRIAMTLYAQAERHAGTVPAVNVNPTMATSSICTAELPVKLVVLRPARRSVPMVSTAINASTRALGTILR